MVPGRCFVVCLALATGQCLHFPEKGDTWKLQAEGGQITRDPTGDTWSDRVPNREWRLWESLKGKWLWSQVLGSPFLAGERWVRQQRRGDLSWVAASLSLRSWTEKRRGSLLPQGRAGLGGGGGSARCRFVVQDLETSQHPSACFLRQTSMAPRAAALCGAKPWVNHHNLSR